MKKKILFYSHDTFGLGHINRVLAICRSIFKKDNISILLVSGSGVIHRLKVPPGVDYIKLPSVTKVGDDQYRSKYLRISLKEILKIRETILFKAAETYKPDLFVVDNVPLGLKSEALRTLRLLKKRTPGCRTILTMRDVLDDSKKIKKTWKENRMYRAIDQYYDHVLVFGMKEIYDIVKEYDIPEPAASKIKFCGYIDKSYTSLSPEKIKKDLNINGSRFILVTAGGGGDGVYMIKNSLEAMLKSGDFSFKCLVALGPDFPKNYEKKIRSDYSGYENIVISNFINNLPDYMRASDLVISMGGYNTVCEIVSLGKKAIIIPRISPRSEQLIRAQKLTQYTPLEYIHPARLNPRMLSKMIKARIFMPDIPSSDIDFGGLTESARIFQEMLAL